MDTNPEKPTQAEKKEDGTVEEETPQPTEVPAHVQAGPLEDLSGGPDAV